MRLMSRPMGPLPFRGRRRPRPNPVAAHDRRESHAALGLFKTRNINLPPGAVFLVPGGQIQAAGRSAERYATFGQVFSIHVYVEVGSPLGHPGGAVMFRIGMVIIFLGSRIWNGRSGEFMLKPVTASLYPW